MSSKCIGFKKIIEIVVIIAVGIAVLFGLWAAGTQTLSAIDREQQVSSRRKVGKKRRKSFKAALQAQSIDTQKATGAVNILSSDDSKMLTFSINVTGLTGPIQNAYFRAGNEKKIITNSFVGDGHNDEAVANGIWRIGKTPEVMNALRNGNLHLIIETTTMPMGELNVIVE